MKSEAVTSAWAWRSLHVRASQTFAKVSVYADERIGEILRGIEQAKRGPKVNSPEGEKTKTETIKESGMSTKTAYDLQAMAENPEVVEAVIAKAEQGYQRPATPHGGFSHAPSIPRSGNPIPDAEQRHRRGQHGVSFKVPHKRFERKRIETEAAMGTHVRNIHQHRL